MNLCLPDGYTSRLDPVAFLDEPQGIEWQPDVLPFASDLARSLDRGTIIDLGCGFGRKLLALDGFRRFGVDVAEAIECVGHEPGVTWIAADLTDPLPYKLVAAADDAVVVCSDVIEHLVDVAPLIGHFRTLLDAGAGAVVVSTPDRDFLDPATHAGPPANPAHVREWTLGELVAMFTAAGFDIVGHGWTRTTDAGPDEHTCMVVIR